LSPRPTLSFRPNVGMSLVTLAVGVLSSLLVAAEALAHGHEIFIKSVPANGTVVTQSPARVVVWFSTELDTGRSRLQIFDADKRQVDTGGGGVDLHDPDHASLIARLPTLPDGAYTVRWRGAVLADGDIVEGKFTFTVSKKR